MISKEKFEGMKRQAIFGSFQYRTEKLSKNQIKEFQEAGFKVIIPSEFDCSKFQTITWRYAKIKCDDIYSLDENDENYSLAQRLWIISKKYKNKTFKECKERATKEGV